MFEQFIGTKSVERKLAFDVAGLERYLRSHIADVKGPLQIEQFKGGQSNPAAGNRQTRGRRHGGIRSCA
jgi:aminoglycoside phosphotransferase (APT) family kinase protein